MSPISSISSNEGSEHGPSSSHDINPPMPGSSNAAQPPSYTRNPPLQDPFRDGDAVVGYIYPMNNGIQKNLKGESTDPLPTTRAPLLVEPLRLAADDPFAEGIILDESHLPSPRPSGLTRGLQIPTRVSLISWGFSFPDILAEQGVSKEHWRLFQHELEQFAYMRLSQWLTVIGCHLLVSYFFSIIAGTVVAWKVSKHKEHENFLQAYRNGLFNPFEDRWNNNYFHPLGLHVRIEPPGIGRLDGMDLASSKLFRYQHKMGTFSPTPGVASQHGDENEVRYQFREGRYHMKAARKGRIVVLPLQMVGSGTTQRVLAGSESLGGQQRGVVTKRSPSATGSVRMNSS